MTDHQVVHQGEVFDAYPSVTDIVVNRIVAREIKLQLEVDVVVELPLSVKPGTTRLGAIGDAPDNVLGLIITSDPAQIVLEAAIFIGIDIIPPYDLTSTLNN